VDLSRRLHQISFSNKAHTVSTALTQEAQQIHLSTPGANVRGNGLAGGFGNNVGSITNNAIQSTTVAAQVQIAASPAVMTVTGSESSQSIVVLPSPVPSAPLTSAPPGNLGALSTTGTDSVTLSSGQYTASSISTTPDSSLNIALIYVLVRDISIRMCKTSFYEWQPVLQLNW
jgi:hypothetical protein